MTGEWAPIRTPTAGRCCATCGSRRSLTTPSTSLPPAVEAEDTATLGKFLRDAVKQNQERSNFRIFGPDETASNRLTAILDATNKQWEAEILPTDDHLAPAAD